ncbi:Predicted arabinose efflux permease, MFS family [Arthrobacter sp. yr096]|uniref:MFS transporter n=1 Tax=unclassified Arthrobacter TaxID=235627 RepID=UPI000898943B|nr:MULTISPECIES: MFS transporter [unclassified Arthrobacter]SDX57715.1 Predicted arabinose efflux permease, MFS family [Arthrobacter sp. cf158]SEJ79655.1 Predicted arabinose efflux permease, MFS family [Arthrobacter sp. yr096]
MTVMHGRDVPSTQDEATGHKDPRKAAMSGWIGSALEYYDFALYSLAATLLFPTIFFPTENATVGIIASLATYAVGYVSRPLGAVVLGAYGDRHGRKKVLVFAMLLMGFATFAVGLLPTYGQVGLLAPVLLVILRLIQGFAVAGELGGASAMIVEHSPDAKRGFFASFSLQGTQVGSILATAVLIPLAALLPDEQFHSWGWRLPFLLSAVVIIAGYVIRRRVQEPPAYLAQSDVAGTKRRFPLVDLLRTHPWVLVRCVVMTFTNVIGMATLIFGVSFATQKGYGIGFSSSEFLWVTMAANVAAVVTIPVFGALSDRIGRRALMVAGGIAGGLLTIGYLWAIEQRSLPLVFVCVVIVQGILFQMWNATFATFFQEQFPMRMRVTGFAVSQNIGLMIASFFPSLFTAIAPPGSANIPLVIGLTTLGICLVSAVATLLSSDTKGKSLEDLETR